jgi:hypothetical protein
VADKPNEQGAMASNVAVLVSILLFILLSFPLNKNEQSHGLIILSPFDINNSGSSIP